MTSYFIPSKKNDFVPHLISKKALSLYLVILSIFNLFVVQLPFAKVQAAVSANELYELHNQERTRLGLPELTINSDLIDSANKKAAAMLASDCWSHFCPDGKSPWDFFDDAGYSYIYAGENLAEGFNGNEEVMSAWMNSPTHKENVIKKEFDEIGIGFATGTFQGITNNTIIVVHFGSRTEAFDTLPNTVQGQDDKKQIEILSPNDGEHTNKPIFDISGNTVENSKVEIKVNDDNLGEVEAEGNNFTYRPRQKFDDGSYKLTASAYSKTSGDFIDESSPIKVTIDTSPPIVVSNTIKVDSLNFSNQEYVIITLKTEGNPQIVRYLGTGDVFTQINDNNWEIELQKEQLYKTTNFTVEATDKAGNSSRAEVPSQTLSRNITEIEDLYTPKTDDSNNLINSLIGNFKDRGVQVQVNIIFMVFLAILFGIDFYAINKSGLTGLKRGKSHLHLGAIILLLIISIVGGLGGGILTGLQLAN